MSLIDIVRRTLQRHQLTGPTTRVAVALSGGPDSMALLHVLHALHRTGALQLAAVAHFDHQLRDSSASDAQFCAGVATSLDLPFITESADVREAASREGRSVEDAAHRLRYAFYDRALTRSGADVMALGHTRDDQAETFLLRLIRGAGSRGLAAMYPRNGSVIRPFLECSRAEVHAFLDTAGLAFVHDASNDDVGIPRNRVRAELLPLLQARFNPAVVEALAGSAELARADEDLLGALARDWVSKHVEAEGAMQRLSLDALMAAPKAVAFRALHEAMSRAAGPRLIGADHVRLAWAVVLGERPAFDAPGHRVERYDNGVVLTGRPAGSAGRPTTVATSPVPGFSHHLPVPGEVLIPEIGCVMSAEVVLSEQNAPRPNGWLAVVPKEKVAAGLGVRNRRPGDRLRPGTAGHRKLQDLFVDRKVPREARDRVPVVTDTDGRIVWVVGHALDTDFRVTDPSQAVVILRLKGVGGSC
ncbi:MAG: tRNA lysidine(34) synthetase TilS [Vicinamibacterales bacterium]